MCQFILCLQYSDNVGWAIERQEWYLALACMNFCIGNPKGLLFWGRPGLTWSDIGTRRPGCTFSDVLPRIPDVCLRPSSIIWAALLANVNTASWTLFKTLLLGVIQVLLKPVWVVRGARKSVWPELLQISQMVTFWSSKTWRDWMALKDAVFKAIICFCF